MKIFVKSMAGVDYPTYSSYPLFVGRIKSSYGLWLYGFYFVEQEGGFPIIHPIYIPAFKFQQEAGQTIIDIHLWRETCLTIAFMEQPPYIWISKSVAMKLDYGEDDE